MDPFYDRKYNNKYHLRFNKKNVKSKKRVKGTVKNSFDPSNGTGIQKKQCFYLEKNTISENNDKNLETPHALDKFETGVHYSINKGKRWEIVEELSKKKEIPVLEVQEIGAYNSKTEVTCKNFGKRQDKEIGKKKKEGRKEGKTSTSEDVFNLYENETKKRSEQLEIVDSIGSQKRKKEHRFSKGGRKDKGVKYRQRSSAPPRQRPEKGLSDEDYKLVHNSEKILYVEVPKKTSGRMQRGNRGCSPDWRMGIERNHSKKKRNKIKNNIKNQMNNIKRSVK